MKSKKECLLKLNSKRRAQIKDVDQYVISTKMCIKKYVQDEVSHFYRGECMVPLY